MERSTTNRYVKLLLGLSLVLIGLTSGILIMLFVNGSSTSESRPGVVERVELGSRDVLIPEITGESGREMPDQPMVLNNVFRRVADRVTTAVVYIQVEMRSRGAIPRDWFHNFDEETRRRFRDESPPRHSVGSGVIISDTGYIVTNNHVVENADRIVVTLSDKRVFNASIVGTDPSTDLAVIRIDEDYDSIPVISFGNSDQIEVGEWVLAVGNPFRLTSTVTAGIVSALGRQVNVIEGNLSIEDFIQTDAAINPGNSGGALVNLKGELVGISTAIATETGSYEGYGFAVPVNLMERVASDLIQFGEVRRGYLGISIGEIDAFAARQLGMDRIGGVYVQNVRSGLAAAMGGMQEGDVVLSINGRSVDAPNELQSAVARHRPGDLLDVVVWRHGISRNLEIELIGNDNPAYRQWMAELNREPSRPEIPLPVPPDEDESEVLSLDSWGIGIRDVSARERDAFEVDAGVFVAYVTNGSVASMAGLPRDVVILKIGDNNIHTIEDVLQTLGEPVEYGDSLILRVKRRDGLSAFYELEIPELQD